MDFYHVYNRGVEKRNVFLENGDYVRFIHDLYVFNDTTSAPNYEHKSRQGDRKRNMLVRIHAFCLMPNHYHLLLSPIEDNGISFFMRKLNMGYAKYFNEKYERSGVLWQGVFKKKHIVRDAHFLYIPHYIHLNPLDLKLPQWRQGKVTNPSRAFAYLKTYRWSSYLDYSGIHNFPSVLYMSYLGNELNSQKMYGEMRDIITDSQLAENSAEIEVA